MYHSGSVAGGWLNNFLARIAFFWNRWRDPLDESDRDLAASQIGSYGLADVGMDWDHRIRFTVICDIWHGLG